MGKAPTSLFVHSGVQTAHKQRLSSEKEEAENKQTEIDEEEDYRSVKWDRDGCETVNLNLQAKRSLGYVSELNISLVLFCDAV